MSSDGQHAVVRDFSDDVPADRVDLVERSIHLLNVLDLYDERNQLQGLVTIGRSGSGKDTIVQSVIDNAQAKLPKVTTDLQQEFSDAAGYQPLAEAGSMTEPEARHAERVEFARFNSAYGRPHKKAQRDAFKAKLAANIPLFQAAGKIEHREPEPMPEAQDRLQAILDDPRAGFLPSTHREKNAILAYLDYLDNNEEYPFGIANQFLEVLSHRQKRSGGSGNFLEARRSLISLVYELGDYRENAQAQVAALTDLQTQVDDCLNPHLTLETAVGEQHPGYGPLIGYLDVQELLGKGSLSGPHSDFSVLHDSEDRPEADPVAIEEDLGKHKTVEDPYTAKQQAEVVKQRIAEKVRMLTIGELRGAVAEARANQETRAQFMQQRLEELLVFGTEPQFVRMLGQVATTADEILAKDLVSA